MVNTENGGASISITDITPREEQEQEDETESSFQTGYYPIAIETAEDAGVRLLVKTFLVPEGTDPQALIEESLTRRGDHLPGIGHPDAGVGGGYPDEAGDQNGHHPGGNG